MGTKDVILLLLGAGLGAVTSNWYGKYSERLRARLLSARIKKRQSQGVALPRQIVKHYQRQGQLGALYSPSRVKSRDPIPVLFEEHSQFNPEISLSGEALLYLDRSVVEPYPVDRRLIDAQARRGIRLFDGEALYVQQVEQAANGEVSFTAARGGFFAYATLVLRIEQSVQSRYRRFHIHRRNMRDLPTAIERLRPLTIGCSCVSVFTTPQGQHLTAIATRSEEVFTGPSLRTVLPNFGMESNLLGDRVSELGLFFYNYIREFAEEFFDLEPLIQAATAKRADPDWILDIPAVSMITEEARAGRLTLRCLGYSVNVTDGALNFSILAQFSSQQFYEWLLRETTANWESAPRTPGALPIQFVNLHDNAIDDWVSEGSVAPTSILALDLARRHLPSSNANAAIPKTVD